MSALGHRASSHRSWILAVAMVLVTACASSPPQTPSPGPTGSFDPNASAWGNILERIGPDGEVDAELAMDAFAVAFAPLPGRPAPPGPRTVIEDGTLAVDWLLRFWDFLTPDQQAFADALIHGRQPGASPAPAAAVNAVAQPMRQPRVIAAAEPTDWPSLLDSMTEQLATKFGRVYTGSLYVEVVPSPIDVPNDVWFSSAWAVSQDAAGDQVGPAEYCTIYITPKGSTWTGADAAFLMAHELFHCFDNDLGQLAVRLAVPAWVKEGAGTWAAADIVSGSTQPAGWWGKWLNTPDKSLYARAYDAIGIYGLLQVTGVDPWSIMDEFLQAAAAGNEAAFAVLYDAGGEAFMDTWGPRYWNDSQLGQLWIYGGAGFSPGLTAPVPIEVVAAAGTTKTIPAPFRGASAFWVEADADVVIISAEGSNGLAKPATKTTGWEIEQVPPLCTLAGGCVCPDGGPVGGMNFEYIAKGSQIVAGVTGNPEVGLVTVKGYSLDDFCREPDDGPCAPGCAASNGDPHMVTVDERTYDFQAAGEFTLLRSSDGAFEVQARQKPFRSSRSVSITSAVAVGLNDDRAAVYVGPTGTRLLVNGEEVSMTETSSAGELQVTAIPNGLQLQAPDGTIVWIMGSGVWGLNVIIAPSDDLRGTGVGLLGPVAGEAGLPALPDGSAVEVGADYRAAVYDILGAGWEVTPDSSLFDYEAGEGPSTFRDPSIPEPGSPLTFSALSTQQQQSGLQACASVTNATYREQCAFDVAVTGEQGFVESYVQTEAALGPQAIEPEPTPTLMPGEDACAVLTDDQILEITGYAVVEKVPGINHSGPFTAGCFWSLDARQFDWTHDLYLNILAPGGRASFDQYLVDWPDLEHVPDLGDDAVLDVGNSSVAVTGDARVDVQYVNVFADAQEAELALIELVRAALAHY